MPFGGAIKLTGESEYRRAVKGIQRNLRELGTEMKLVNAQYDKNDHSIEATNARNKVLNKQLTQNKTKLKEATRALDEMTKGQEKSKKAHAELGEEVEQEKRKLSEIEKTLDKSSDEYKEQAKVVKELESAYSKSEKTLETNENKMSRLRQSINRTKTSIAQQEKALDKNNEAYEEHAKANKTSTKLLDKFKKSTDDTGNSAIKAGTLIKANLASQGIIAGIKGMGRAIASVGRGFVQLGKQSLESYAQQEQLIGGVETLFKGSSSQVQQYAQNAYKTSGLTANQYMEQVTGFSAAMINSLGGDTVKAAKMSNMAITDMSDNAAKFGSDMESVQNAYQGFAKGNYTMLDNLKLGKQKRYTNAQHKPCENGGILRLAA